MQQVVCNNVVHSQYVKNSEVNIELNEQVDSDDKHPVEARESGKWAEHLDSVQVVREDC